MKRQRKRWQEAKEEVARGKDEQRTHSTAAEATPSYDFIKTTNLDFVETEKGRDREWAREIGRGRHGEGRKREKGRERKEGREGKTERVGGE